MHGSLVEQGYGPLSYKGEINSFLEAMRSQGLKTQNQLISPSVNGKWPIEEVIDAGLLVDFTNEIGILSVEKYAEHTGSPQKFPKAFARYPSDNCAAAFKTSTSSDG